MSANNRFVCFHGHFYQPPRENPWLETVETEDSAAPYHDWNELICAECYSTNGAARVVNNKNQITRIVNNYEHISFDFGPTLLSWLMENEPRTYRMVLDGERRSRRNFKGHSSAMAQVYNHIIMPLANHRDRITQIRWGIADYQRHFDIAPEGMWLAETAVDNETLELLAQHGIKFTVLAPHQCKHVRPLNNNAEWTETPGASVNTTHPYMVRFDSGVSIAVFFYDGPASRAIAFEGLLNSGEGLAARLKGSFKNNSQPQLAHVATDGESYGHHHKYGEMALAYALQVLEKDESLNLTNYGCFLEEFPPEYEAEIVENTSWSCVHGVERWRSDCGCNNGKAGWNQAWRGPLRGALDFLRDALIPLTEQEGAKLFKDVWAARDEYIGIMLDHNPQSVEQFFAKHQLHTLDAPERVRALQLMEMQRHTLLMYTSCGWFFDDISGIETVQIIAYAARVLQLAEDLFDEQAAPLKPILLARLAQAHSNVAAAGDGAKIYEEQVITKQLRLEKVAAHYAISSIFSSFAEETELFCFHIWRDSYDVYTSGRGQLVLGRIRIITTITGKQGGFCFAVLHFGDQNITAAVKAYEPDEAAAFETFASEAAGHVQHANFPEVMRLLDRYYGHTGYSLTSLFTDEQRRIVKLILTSTLSDIENSLANIYDDHASLLHFLSQAGLPKPPALTLAAGFAINAGLRRALAADPVNEPQLRSFLAVAKTDQVPLDATTLAYIAVQRMKSTMFELQMSSGSMEILERAVALVHALKELPFELDLWQAQNIWYEILRTSSYALTALATDERPHWEKDFCELGTTLSIDCDAIGTPYRTFVNVDDLKVKVLRNSNHG